LKMMKYSEAHYIQLDTRRLAYREAGNGPAVLFLHGLGGNSASWEPQIDALSDRYRLIAWDMPGFANSDRMGRPTATRDYSELARELLDHLGIEHAVGVGASYGTVILADLASRYPSRIDAMVFACGVTGVAHLELAQREKLRAIRSNEIETLGQKKFAETRNSTYLGKGQSSELVERVVDLAGSADPQGYLEAYNSLTEANIFPSLASIQCRIRCDLIETRRGFYGIQGRLSPGDTTQI
jgi:pimeloyl-ACP methyl ester carboxylesterase